MWKGTYYTKRALNYHQMTIRNIALITLLFLNFYLLMTTTIPSTNTVLKCFNYKHSINFCFSEQIRSILSLSFQMLRYIFEDFYSYRILTYLNNKLLSNDKKNNKKPKIFTVKFSSFNKNSFLLYQVVNHVEKIPTLPGYPIILIKMII